LQVKDKKSADEIEFAVWDTPNNREAIVIIELKTGHVKGGASLDLLNQSTIRRNHLP
jgi:hypothetical protein